MIAIYPLASGPFFSLNNTDFVVTIAFIVFIAILLYVKLPGKIAGLLDARAEGIKAELDEARKLREEAQTLLASYERKQKDVADQAGNIVATAKSEAEAAAAKAKEDLKASMARRLQAATDQIASAEAAAVKEVKDRAVTVAVRAAQNVLRDKIGADAASGLIDDAIKEVGNKLH